MSIPAALAAIGAKLAGNLMQSALNRSDYNYTYRLTRAQQQVQDLREAGLNPALAYGQVGASAGQSLGNYQGADDVGELVQKDPLIKSQIETSEAQRNVAIAQADYYNRLAESVGEDYRSKKFINDHQAETYQLDFINKGLQNDKLSSEIRSVRLKNTWQEIENDIHKIDKDKHGRLLESEISKNVRQAGLFLAMKQTEDVLRNSKLENLRQNIRTAIKYRMLLASEIGVNEKRRISEKYQGELLKINHGFMSYLTKNNTDFSKLDAREKWQIYSPAISSAVSSVINAGVLIGTRGLSGFLGNSKPNFNPGSTLRSYPGADEDYFGVE